MKRKKLLFSLFTLLVLTIVGALTYLPKTNVESDNYIKSEEENDEGIDGAVDFYHRQMANFQTGEIEVDKIMAARDAARKISSSKALNLSWSEMGPNNVGGRVRALLIDKDNNQLMYAGGVNGGLWKSTTGGQSWVEENLDGNLAVVSICQTNNGDLFVGTGEGLAQPGNTNHNSGALGAGIYHKPANSSTYTQIPATANWQKVNRLAADKNGVVYAATSLGLWTTSDYGANWTRAKVGSYNDVKIAPNSTRIVATSGNKVYISDDGSTWLTATPANVGGARVEVGIAYSNTDIIYAVVASNGDFTGIYRTIDGGTTWNQIAVGGSSSFDLFGSNNQGWYDNVVMVNTANPDIVYVGGIDLWKGVKVSNTSFSWTKKSLWTADDPTRFSYRYYVHADQHVYTPVPGNPNSFYIGCDGGIFKTIDGANTFATLNKNFNVTQFYAVTSHPNGGVLGGAQDNGTQFLDLQGNSSQLMQARKIRGGDGGWAAASMLNQDVLFASIYYGNVGRSSDFGEEFQGPSDPSTGDPEFYSSEMLSGLAGAFVTPLALWETINFPNSEDSVYIVADTTYSVGDTIDGRSMINNSYPFAYKLNQNLNTGDTIKVADPVQSRLFIGTARGIWMTKQALYFANKTPVWYLISENNYTGTAVWNIQVSRDGDVVYYAINNHLMRITNLLNAQGHNADVRDSAYALQDTLIKDFSGIISSISIDPSDANRIIVTLSGTGNDQVYYSSNATSSNPTFAVKKGNLPANLPVYASVIPLNNSTQAIIGTQYGIYTTDNILSPNPTWSKSDDGIGGMITVYMLYQQQNTLAWRKTIKYDNGAPLVQIYPGVYNTGQIYAATHGRGFFTSKSYMSIKEKSISKATQLSTIKFYPNPVIDIANFEYTLNKASKVTVNIFDISGRLLNSVSYGTQISGKHKSEINLNDLPSGAYFLQLQTEEGTSIKKFIKR
jgi:hypothetical protein